MSESKFEVLEEIVELPVDEIEFHEDNPNEMTDEEFNFLLDDIEQYGFDEPLQVVPHPEKEGNYLVIGGNHRLKALKLLGYAKAPCVVHTDMDQKEQRLFLVRRNKNRGTINYKKFDTLLDKIKKDHDLEIDTALREMAITDSKEVKRIVARKDFHEREALKKASGEAKKKANLSKTVTNVVNSLFEKHGETAGLGYMYFADNGKFHLIVRTEEKLAKLVDKMCSQLKNNNEQINEFLVNALSSELSDE